MTAPRSRPALAAVAAIALALGAAGPASALGQRPRPAAPPDAEAPVVVSGAVEVRGASGAFTPVPAADRPPGRKDLRVVGAAPLVLRSGDAVVEIAPGSVVALEGRIEILGAAAHKPAAKVQLRAGRLQARVPSGSTDQVLVLAGDHMAVARGGAVLVAAAGLAGSPRALHVALYDGEGAYSVAGAWRPLAKGEVRRLGAGAGPATRALLAAPAWDREATSAPRGGGSLALVGADGARAALGLRVGALPGAASYVLEVARTEAFDELVSRTEAKEPGPIASQPLPEGRYVARARAVDADGFHGAASPPRRVRVARLRLPPGATLADDTLTLPPGAPVTLVDPSDLEIRRAVARFEPAPQRFDLDDDAPQRLALRLRGEADAIAIALAPRDVRADVELGPKTAVWPLDPVTIAVRVRGPVGPAYEPKIVVRVNREEVRPTWTRQGDELRAVLEPRDPPGPWVVRVEALDETGAPLGRGFLEVIASTGPRAAR